MNSHRGVMPERVSKGSAEPAAPSVIPTEVLRYSSNRKPAQRADTVAAEEPFEIRVRGRGIAVTMRTPGHDSELAAGFLLSEGIIRKHSDVVGMTPCLQSDCPENTFNVFLAPSVKVDFKHLTRHVFASSSCGLCGKASIEAVHQQFAPVHSPLRVSPRTLFQIPVTMRAAQSTFDRTGGLHAAAVFDAKGRLLVLREDVGRHNAVDKVIGYGLLGRKLPFDSHLLLVSGRASFEIMQKALAARIPMVCAISAPSSLAIEFARDSGQTLVGFLRGRTMNVYSGPERIG
jgi:FdhD protein